MKTILIASTLAALFSLTACSTVEPAASPAKAEEASASTAQETAPMTGSRIPAKRTEKMVGQIGSKDYKEDKNAMAAPFKTP